MSSEKGERGTSAVDKTRHYSPPHSLTHSLSQQIYLPPYVYVHSRREKNFELE